MQPGRQLARVDIIIFDGVARLQDARLLQSRDGRHQGRLHIPRQGGGNPVGVDGMIVETFRLQKNLMTLAGREAHHLILD